jgi:hypothetical protein
VTSTPSRLVKPARWAARGPRLQDNHLLQDCLALFPLWDGGGPDAIELMRHVGAAYHAQWEVAPNWGTGRAELCTVHDGADTVGLNVTGSFTSLSKLKQSLPLTIEALVEPFSSNPAEQGTIFCNDGVRAARYRGIVLTQTATGAFQLFYGDGTGDSSGDRAHIHRSSQLHSGQQDLPRRGHGARPQRWRDLGGRREAAGHQIGVRRRDRLRERPGAHRLAGRVLGLPHRL